MSNGESLPSPALPLPLSPAQPQPEGHAKSPTWLALRRLRRSKAALLAAFILGLFTACALLAPLLAPYEPHRLLPGASLQPPGAAHLLGADLLGRDILSRLLYGARISLFVGFAAILLSLVAGVLLGLVAGYAGGATDNLIMRGMDMMLAFPGILLALTLVSFLGTSLTHLTLAVGVSFIPTFARLTRGSVLAVKEMAYVEAARSLGGAPHWIVRRHILPNVLGPVIVLASLAYGWAILAASSLSFLGLGVQPPTPEWGVMVNDGRGYLREAPWISAFPGLAIMLVVFAANILGDALRDALDPHEGPR